MGEMFKGRYQVQDGYVGGSRPKHVMIDASHLENDMSYDELTEFYDGAIQGHFEENVTPGAELVDEFVAWAREQLAKRAAQQTKEPAG